MSTWKQDGAPELMGGEIRMDKKERGIIKQGWREGKKGMYQMMESEIKMLKRRENTRFRNEGWISEWCLEPEKKKRECEDDQEKLTNAGLSLDKSCIVYLSLFLFLFFQQSVL